MSLSNNDCVTSEHLAHTAIVYVRQSSPRQVHENVESTRLQLNLRENAIALGWREPLVIADDLGISAAGFRSRPGFQQLLARVAMKEVGIILCFEASRLSRNSKDWAHLFELCCHFNTLIADLEQVYDLSRPYDRLIMGIKGTISEMELTLLQNRFRAGMEAKAARGELRLQLPIGYEYDPSGQIVFAADKRIRVAVETVFEQFNSMTSIRQLRMWFRDTDTHFPVQKGARRDRPQWGVPPYRTLHNLLQNPAYAGAYVWGRRYTKVDYVDGELVKRQGGNRSFDQCRVCIRDHHCAYITWERLLENCAKIAENRPRWKMEENKGAIRDGLALLVGLLRCGHCGGKIYVSYRDRKARYFCDGEQEKCSGRCLSFGSTLIDRPVSSELSKALGPLAVKAAIVAEEMKATEVSRAIENARLEVESAQFEADRAFEQFDLCDPKNRLVADTLEERLNGKLAELQSAKQKLQHTSKENHHLTEEQRARLHDLARDFPSVWDHSAAEPKLKKQLLRAAIREILVKDEPDHRRLEITIHWQGGAHTRIHAARPAKPRSKGENESLIELVRQLSGEVSDAEIARILNMKKITTRSGLRWTKDRVQCFRKEHRLRRGKPLRDDADYLTMQQAMEYLEISYNAICRLEEMGAISKNQITDFAPWRVSRAELDSDSVQGLVRTLKATGRLPKGGSPKNQLTLFDGLLSTYDKK